MVSYADMVLKYREVLVWVVCFLFKVVLIHCQVTFVNRNVTDSFRVGKYGCSHNSNCSGSICQSDSGVCLCKDDRPNFLNSSTDYGCLPNEHIRKGIGGFSNCLLGPFQLLPYSPEDLAAKFVDQQVSSRALTSCTLRYAMIKFPDNVNETKLDWLNESYVDLGVSNKTLHFKWKKSVPDLRGTIITLFLHCTFESGSYNPCLRAKVLGIWPEDKKNPTVETPVTSHLISNTTVATSSVYSNLPTSAITAASSVHSNPSKEASSGDDDSNGTIIIIAVVAPLALLIILTVVIWLICRRKKRNRMQDNNMKMKEIPNTDQQRKSRTGGDIETYDEVVSRSGIHNDGFHNQPFPSSANEKNKKRFSEHNYEEPALYEPLRRNPLQDQGDEHKYQSLIK